MNKRVVGSFFGALFALCSVASYAGSAPAPVNTATRAQAQQLYNALQQYPQNLSVAWLDNVSHLLAQDDNSFSFIYPVCMQQAQCMDGAASFPTESVGLFNSLQTIKPVVAACATSNNPYVCVREKTNPAVLGMITGDINQVLFQLQAYLGS